MLRKSVLILLRLVGKLVAVGALALLGRGEGVVVSIQPTVRLGAELGLEGGELLRDAEEAAHLHAQDHPNDVCRRRGTRSVLEHTFKCIFPCAFLSSASATEIQTAGIGTFFHTEESWWSTKRARPAPRCESHSETDGAK